MSVRIPNATDYYLSETSTAVLPGGMQVFYHEVYFGVIGGFRAETPFAQIEKKMCSTVFRLDNSGKALLQANKMNGVEMLGVEIKLPMKLLFWIQ